MRKTTPTTESALPHTMLLSLLLCSPRWSRGTGWGRREEVAGPAGSVGDMAAARHLSSRQKWGGEPGAEGVAPCGEEQGRQLGSTAKRGAGRSGIPAPWRCLPLARGKPALGVVQDLDTAALTDLRAPTLSYQAHKHQGGFGRTIWCV